MTIPFPLNYFSMYFSKNKDIFSCNHISKLRKLNKYVTLLSSVQSIFKFCQLFQ